MPTYPELYRIIAVLMINCVSGIIFHVILFRFLTIQSKTFRTKLLFMFAIVQFHKLA